VFAHRAQAGGQFIFWVADWFALMNDKMGGGCFRWAVFAVPKKGGLSIEFLG